MCFLTSSLYFQQNKSRYVERNQRPAEFDGLLMTDRCAAVRKQAPVHDSGCVPFRFELHPQLLIIPIIFISWLLFLDFENRPITYSTNILIVVVVVVVVQYLEFTNPTFS